MHATQAETNAYRDAARAEFEGEPYDINANGPGGLHVRCQRCGITKTRNPELFMRQHAERCRN